MTKLLIILTLLSTFALSGGQTKVKTLLISTNTTTKKLDTLRRENDEKLRLLINKILKQNADKKSKTTL